MVRKTPRGEHYLLTVSRKKLAVNPMDPYGVLQENIWCVAREHMVCCKREQMVCCKSTYGAFQENRWGLSRGHMGSSKANQRVIRGHPEGHLGSFWGSFGIIRRAIWDHPGDHLGSSGGVENSKKQSFRKIDFVGRFPKFLYKTPFKH